MRHCCEKKLTQFERLQVERVAVRSSDGRVRLVQTTTRLLAVKNQYVHFAFVQLFQI